MSDFEERRKPEPTYGDGPVPEDDDLYEDPLRAARGIIFALIATGVTVLAAWALAQVIIPLFDLWRW